LRFQGLLLELLQEVEVIMPRILLFSGVLILLVCTTAPALATTVQGITFADSIQAGSTSLPLRQIRSGEYLERLFSRKVSP
jgi:hypothetical protein